MNYEGYIEQTYLLEFEHDTNVNGAFLMLANGDVHYVVDNNVYDNVNDLHPYYDVVNYMANYANRTYNEYANMIMYWLASEERYELITRDIVDYVVTDSYTSDVAITLSCLNGEAGYLEDLNMVTGYAERTAVNTFTDYTYDSQAEQGVSNHTKLVTDFTNIAPFTNGSTHYQEYNLERYVVRGENVTYNKYIVEITPNSLSNMKISYGSPFSRIANNEYQRGYNGGYATGWVEGQYYGFEQGTHSGIDGNTHNALGYVKQAFGVVDNIMQLQVLPNITLGLVFSIPMVLVAIMVIFKIVKK